jgi:RNA polymerase sigma factor (sigma-70 family)
MSEGHFQDQVLVEAIKNGGYKREKALAYIFSDTQLKQKVQHYVRQNKGNIQDGEDLFAEGLIVFDRNIRQNKFRQDSSPQVYFVAICKFLWMNKLRKMKRIQWTDSNFKLDKIESITPEKIAMTKEQKENIEKLLASLGKKCHKILTMWMLNFSMKEIAESLNFTNDAIARKNKYRCFKKLKELMKDAPT